MEPGSDYYTGNKWLQGKNCHVISAPDKKGSLDNLEIQYNFSDSNTDGSFTMAVSNSFLNPLEKSHCCRFRMISGNFLFYIENGILCVLVKIALMRRF